MPIPPPRGANVPLNDAGVARGVEFQAERTLTVSDTTKNTIGNIGSVSVITNGGTTARGSINFAVAATVSGRIGGALNTGAAFKSSPANLLNRVDISGSASKTVTFNGGVGAQTLDIASNSTALLKGPAAGSGDIFHRMNVTATTATSAGGGTLSFENPRPANFRGSIGATGSPLRKLNSLNIMALADGARTVRVLGDISANGIALNGNTLTLGTQSVFNTSAPATPYTVQAPITTNATGTGVLNIKDYDVDLKGLIGSADTSAKLAAVTIDNASATFDANINANAVTLNAGARDTQLALNANDVTISGTLALNNSAAGGATLAPGGQTLIVSGALTFNTNPAPANRHKLSLTVDGTAASAGFGGLDARAGVSIQGSGPDIEVTVDNAASMTSARTVSIVKSNAALTLANYRVTCLPASVGCSLKLSTNSRELQLTVTPPPQLIDADTTPGDG